MSKPESSSVNTDTAKLAPCTCHGLELSVLKPSVSRPLVVCCESLCHVFEHEHRVIELRDEMWYVNKIRVKWVQSLNTSLLTLQQRKIASIARVWLVAQLSS